MDKIYHFFVWFFMTVILHRINSLLVPPSISILQVSLLMLSLGAWKEAIDGYKKGGKCDIFDLLADYLGIVAAGLLMQ